jgi:hypothetical protein
MLRLRRHCAPLCPQRAPGGPPRREDLRRSGVADWPAPLSTAMVICTLHFLSASSPSDLQPSPADFANEIGKIHGSLLRVLPVRISYRGSNRFITTTRCEGCHPGAIAVDRDSNRRGINGRHVARSGHT